MAASQSKMPPQQRDGLLDLFVEGVGFGGHGGDPFRGGSIEPAESAVDPGGVRVADSSAAV
jgi:hypothetical protein